jgi:hypothetical protein
VDTKLDHEPTQGAITATRYPLLTRKFTVSTWTSCVKTGAPEAISFDEDNRAPRHSPTPPYDLDPRTLWSRIVSHGSVVIVLIACVIL